MRPLAEGLTASGLLVSREEAGVASELSGYRVAQVLVDEGAWVTAGQPLARLDDTLLRAQIAQQRANAGPAGGRRRARQGRGRPGQGPRQPGRAVARSRSPSAAWPPSPPTPPSAWPRPSWTTSRPASAA